MRRQGLAKFFESFWRMPMKYSCHPEQAFHLSLMQQTYSLTQLTQRKRNKMEPHDLHGVPRKMEKIGRDRCLTFNLLRSKASSKLRWLNELGGRNMCSTWSSGRSIEDSSWLDARKIEQTGTSVEKLMGQSHDLFFPREPDA